MEGALTTSPPDSANSPNSPTFTWIDIPTRRAEIATDPATGTLRDLKDQHWADQNPWPMRDHYRIEPRRGLWQVWHIEGGKPVFVHKEYKKVLRRLLELNATVPCKEVVRKPWRDKRLGK